MARKLNEVFNTEQTFIEHITPRYYKDTIDLVDLREGIELIEKKYSKYWDVITIKDINMDKPYDIGIQLDCYRDKENYNTDTFKKIKTEKYLKEGPGAGYTIEYEITDIKNVTINNQKVVDDDTISIDCSVIAEAFVRFENYYYGDEFPYVPIEITNLEMEKSYDTTEEFDKDDIYYALLGLKAKSYQGGGWSHATYKGDLYAKNNSITDTGEGFWVYEISGYITDDEIVEFIDRVLTGDFIHTEYNVFDEDDELIETFDTEDEAIDFAKNNNCIEVEMVTYREQFDGLLIDEDSKTVWRG